CGPRVRRRSQCAANCEGNGWEDRARSGLDLSRRRNPHGPRSRTTATSVSCGRRAAGITNLNVDLIAGLPHQTAETWQGSVAQTLATGASHVSVYMLEVDEDSRLGREVIAGGTRYHAHFVPDEEATAD